MYTKQCLRNQLRKQKRRESYGFSTVREHTPDLAKEHPALIAAKINDPLNVLEDARKMSYLLT